MKRSRLFKAEMVALLQVFAALEDAHEGWVWLPNSSLPEHEHRVVRITNPANRKSVYCETCRIDDNFLFQYNQPRQYNQHRRRKIENPKSAIVIGGWYRHFLGELQTKTEVALEVQPCPSPPWSWWWKFKACTDHPHIVVRLTAWLGGIGLLLAVISLLLTVISLVLR